MDRRNFSKNLATGLAIVPFVGCSIPRSGQSNNNAMQIKNIKPKKLFKGATIGLIAPASPYKTSTYENAKINLDKFGFKVVEGKHLHDKLGYLAGTDADRVQDLHDMFINPSIDAVWCIRGGYGMGRILPMIDFDIIAENPKIFVGYSDITALHVAIQQRIGLVTFHGPTFGSDLTDYSFNQLQNILEKGTSKTVIPYQKTETDNHLFESYVIRPGIMKGKLSGGNLSLLSAACGTPYELDATDKLIFIEDIEEKPYRIDRMLTQLRQSSNLDKSKGIILGVFEGCSKKEGDTTSLSLKEVLHDRLGDLGVPVVYGFSFGHIGNNCTIPMGIEASFNTEKMELVLEENTVNG